MPHLELPHQRIHGKEIASCRWLLKADCDWNGIFAQMLWKTRAKPVSKLLGVGSFGLLKIAHAVQKTPRAADYDKKIHEQ